MPVWRIMAVSTLYMAVSVGKPTACSAPHVLRPVQSSRKRWQSKAGKEPRLDRREERFRAAQVLQHSVSRPYLRLQEYLRTSNTGFNKESLAHPQLASRHPGHTGVNLNSGMVSHPA